jgi:hypothetical protein
LEVVGNPGDSTILDLEYSNFRAPITLNELLPYWTVNDSMVIVNTPQGNVVSASIPSNSTPNKGDTITVDIEVDMRGMQPPDSLLGSFVGYIEWDPTVLEYNSHSLFLPAFAGDINVDTIAGIISFNGVSVLGVGNVFNLFEISLEVVGNPGDSTILDLEYSNFRAPITLNELLPYSECTSQYCSS